MTEMQRSMPRTHQSNASQSPPNMSQIRLEINRIFFPPYEFTIKVYHKNEKMSTFNAE